ncbi:MAG: hypothetical protein ABJB17_07330 [Burkholderiales bacterium]
MLDSLTMDNFSFVIDPFRLLLLQLGAYLPRLLLAALVLMAGWLIAKAVRFSAIKLLHALNFQVLAQRSGIDGFLEQGGSSKDTTALFGWVGYAVIWLLALVIAFDTLGLRQVADLLGIALLFVPRLLVAMLLIVLGCYFARFIGEALRSYLREAGKADAELLGNVLHYGIVIFVVLLSVDHLNVGGGLIQKTFLILLAGVVLALALAFGLGGRERAAELLARLFPRDRIDR